MKRITFFVLTLCFMASLKANGQAAKPSITHPKLSKGNMQPANAPCNILCCDKSFPYDFCNPNGTVTTKCSTNPSGGADGVPAKSFIPSCVKIIGSMRTDGLMMPITSPPHSASQITTDFDTSEDSIPLHTYLWWGAWLQYDDDSISFAEGQPPAPDPYDVYTSEPGPCPDSAAYITIENPADTISLYAVTPYDNDPYPPQDNPSYIEDSTTYAYQVNSYRNAVHTWNSDWNDYNHYLGTVQQYTRDSIAWINNENSYTQIWSDAQADSDANEALQNWLNVCSPPVPPSLDSSGQCCLDVKLDNNVREFTISTTAAQTVDNQGNPGYPKCGETTCPESTRFIEVNISDAALNQNLQTSVPDVSQYTLYTVHPTGFYTDPQFNPTVYNGFSVQSFFMTVEHEMGHYFGLHHPEGDAGKGDFWLCHNCYTQNPYISITGNRNPSGYQSVMAQSNIEVNTPTFNLSDDDKCQFQKLYCNPCGTDGVIEDKSENGPYPEIFPNPTTGACQLQYELLDRAFVQVAIYDVLGNQMRLVSSGYEELGTRTISLGTESLPSGNYVCRVRVGESVAYINLVIKK